MTNDEMVQWIDTASYEDLLRKWRFEPAGSPFFSLGVGEYFAVAMEERKKNISFMDGVNASKKVGWEA